MLDMPERGGAIFDVTRVAQAQEQLETFLKHGLEGIAVERVILQGDSARRIVEYAHSQQMGLILMPTHGYGPFRRFLLGSVTAKVLHDAVCPVWTGVHLEEVPENEHIALRHMVCAVDLGPQSGRVLCWAKQLADKFHARLTLVHIVPETETAPVRYFDQDLPVFLANKAKEALQRVQDRMGILAEVYIGRGDPAKALKSVSEKLGADLLVIGRSSGTGVLGRLRANAYAIIRESPCPVVSV